MSEKITLNEDDLRELQGDIDTILLRVKNIRKAAIKSVDVKNNLEIPKVFISREEAARLLNTSNTAFDSLVKTDLITVQNSRIRKRDKYLLSEILWLAKMPFKNARNQKISEILRVKPTFED